MDNDVDFLLIFMEWCLVVVITLIIVYIALFTNIIGT